jgi:hypothetical protein
MRAEAGADVVIDKLKRATVYPFLTSSDRACPATRDANAGMVNPNNSSRPPGRRHRFRGMPGQTVKDWMERDGRTRNSRTISVFRPV